MENQPCISEQFLITMLWIMSGAVVFVAFFEHLLKATKFIIAFFEIIIFHKILKRW